MNKADDNKDFNVFKVRSYLDLDSIPTEWSDTEYKINDQELSMPDVEDLIIPKLKEKK